METDMNNNLVTNCQKEVHRSDDMNHVPIGWYLLGQLCLDSLLSEQPSR